MSINKLPAVNMEDNETGCCPRFDPEPWDEKTFQFDEKPFVKVTTINFFHTPLNMGSVTKKTWKKIKEANADSPEEFALLSHDPSPWRGEHYFTTTKEVPGANNVKLSGTFLTKVFEGPYREAGSWAKEMEEYVKSQGEELKNLYFYYTTCPKCAKYYGKNYVVGFAQV